MKKRPRLRFGLLALFVIVTFVCIALVPIVDFYRELERRSKHIATLQQHHGFAIGYTVKPKSVYSRFEDSSIDQVTSVSLHGADVGDDDLHKLMGLNNLQTVFISDTAITDVGLSRLGELPALARLSILNSPVTRAGVEKFSSQRPDVHVFMWQGEGRPVRFAAEPPRE